MFLFDWIDFSNNIPEDCLGTWWNCDWTYVSISVHCINNWQKLTIKNLFTLGICLFIKLKWFEKVIYDIFNFKTYWFIIFLCIKNDSHSGITMVSSISFDWGMDCMHLKIILLPSYSMLGSRMKMELESLKLCWISLHVFTSVLRHKEVWYFRFFIFFCRQKYLCCISNPFNYHIQRVFIFFYKFVCWITYSGYVSISAKSW